MIKFIKNLKTNDTIEDVYFLKKKELALTQGGKPYLKLTLSDKSGRMEAKMWENAEAADEMVATGAAVFVQGRVDSFKGDLQIRVDQIRIADPKEYKFEDLVRSVEKPDEIFKNIKGMLDGISEKWLAELAKEFLADEELMAKFKKSPGAQSWHNAYIGGLMEHTYEVMRISGVVCDLYTEADRDIVMIGAFAHDIGKTVELDINTFEYTVDGGLIGHLTLGYEMVSGKIKDIKGFPRELALRLKHIILSHHGEYEQQSPILPKTLEATIVYQADELVSQANAVKEIITQQSGGDKVWSSFVSLKSR
ncbi:MAG: HD domain-containing protein, partial [Candidatus Omnitrophica bacterium]|nr:HD domain-containing protein [Candidatus Omnitrophota bacterium]